MVALECIQTSLAPQFNEQVAVAVAAMIRLQAVQVALAAVDQVLQAFKG